MYKVILIEHISDNEEKYILENIINEISYSNNVYMLNNKYSYKKRKYNIRSRNRFC